MNIDSYLEGSSFYHRFDVRPKLLLTLLYIIAVFFLKGVLAPLSGVLVPLAVMLLSLGWAESWRVLKRLVPLTVLIFVLVPFQIRKGESLWTIGGFTVMTREGFYSAYVVVMRIWAISLTLTLLLVTERSADIIRGLRACRLPYNAALAVSLVLRFIPYLGSLFTEIRDSMSLRLTEGKRGYPVMPSITAFIVASLRMIPSTAAALEERGFGRSSRYPDEPLPIPRGYLLQCGASILIPIILIGIWRII